MSDGRAPLGIREARRAFERFTRWTIEREPHHDAPYLPEGEREAFAAYYRALPRPGDETAIRRYLRGFWRGEAGFTSRWIARRAAPRVLDAGSGFGSYAMLYAAMGARVVGADLRPDRLDAAERRLAHYRQDTGESLEVRYARADLTRPWSDDFDLVWVYNALSHIDPLDAFLARVREHLRPGGVLVVGDINGAHPAHQRRLEGVRTEVHQEYVAPDGTRHAYAVERTFSPDEMRRAMLDHGLRVVRHELYWGGLGRLPEALYLPLLAPLQRVGWAARAAARRQLMVAARADGRAAEG